MPHSSSQRSAPFEYDLPYASRRMPVIGRQAVAASHPTAAQVALSILAGGGNAIDAAVAGAAALAVVEPTMNGIGGDSFALVWDGAKLHGLNATGRAPAAWSLARFERAARMPELGWDAVTVPGAVSGWVALCERFGSKPLGELLAPAIRYAREGSPVLPAMGALWAAAPARFAGFDEFQRVFLPGGRAPAIGSFVRFPDAADTLAAIGESRGESFYRGDLARRMAAASRAAGGAMTEEDLAAHRPEWVAPISVSFGDARVHELPPNGQGLATLIALGILAALPLREGSDHPDTVHLQIEAMKAAFADCRQHLADPARMRVDPAELLAPSRLAARAAEIRLDRAAPPRASAPPDHGTVCIMTADREGRMVSLIQSNYLGFGSGVVVPGTGISLHNRALGFSLDPAHPNGVAGGARPYHTLMPGFLTRGGEAAMVFGVMGGHAQPQGHVQLVLRTVLHRQNPQAACDAPRWHVTETSDVALEAGFSAAVRNDLAKRGHRLVDDAPLQLFGGAQAIYQLPEGYLGASDPRKDGQAVAS
jgi:gamma-glutamyltranspeptidase/glutathione hydrolase